MSTPISRQGHDPRAPSTVPRAAGTRKLFSKLANIGDICPRGFVSAAGAIPADHNRATPNRRNQQNCRSSSGRSGLLSTWTKLTPPASHPTLAHLARHDWSAGYHRRADARLFEVPRGLAMQEKRPSGRFVAYVRSASSSPAPLAPHFQLRISGMSSPYCRM